MHSRNAKIGMILFLIYLALYGGFVFLNAFAADVMESTPLAGVNLAILYGFGLIVVALVLALLYGFLCIPAGDAMDGDAMDGDAMDGDAMDGDATDGEAKK